MSFDSSTFREFSLISTSINCRYDWPGNIRELEHLIERNILLAKGPVIEDKAFPHPREKGMLLPWPETM